MQTKKSSGASGWVDPDDAPILTEAFFDKAEVKQGDAVVRRGRPKSEKPKVQVTLRLDRDVITGFKSTGPGWQSRINEALASYYNGLGARGVAINGATSAGEVVYTSASGSGPAPQGEFQIVNSKGQPKATERSQVAPTGGRSTIPVGPQPFVSRLKAPKAKR